MGTDRLIGTELHEFKGRPLGRILIKLGKLTRADVHQALLLQQQQHRPIGEILVSLGHVTESDVQHALCLQRGL